MIIFCGAFDVFRNQLLRSRACVSPERLLSGRKEAEEMNMRVNK